MEVDLVDVVQLLLEQVDSVEVGAVYVLQKVEQVEMGQKEKKGF